MKWTRILIAIIASVWFFPVNCSGSLVAGTFIVRKLDSRDVEKGDTVHPLFSFVVESSASGQPFLAARLGELPNIKKRMGKPGTSIPDSFLMSEPNGRITSNNSHISYQVIEDTDSGQIIEVIESYLDGDNTIWSRYRATETTLTPICSSMVYFGYVFKAFPYAFGFALSVYMIGRFLKSRKRAQKMASSGS